MWVLALIVAIFGAVMFMNNLTSAQSSFKNQLAIIKRKHTWIMAFIYVGTFGSFIGYSAAFPLLIKTQFPAVTIAIAFLGPLVGLAVASVRRPAGRQGRRRDRDVLEFRRDGRRHNRRAVLRRCQGFHRLPGDVPNSVRYHRRRQRFDLPDDPFDLPRGKYSQSARQGRSRPGARDEDRRESRAAPRSDSSARSALAAVT